MTIRPVANSLAQLLLAVVCVICTAPYHLCANAAVPGFDQQFKLTASDSDAFDFFGSSVGISGNLVITGAYGDNDAGGNSGSAYLTNKNTGQQLFKLVASDAEGGAVFGSSVGISGNRAIVGAYLDNSVGIDDGSAYLFDTTNGQQLFKLAQPNGEQDDHFGTSVGIAGNTAIVGAPRRDVAQSGTNVGLAYLFDSNTGQLTFTLTAPDAHGGEQFGSAVSIRDNIAIVGAFADNVHGPSSGSAYLFNATNGLPMNKLVPADGQQLDSFGTAVAVSNSFALIGAQGDDDNGLDSGSAYVFNVNTGQQLFKLKPTDGQAQARFGISVAFSGNFAIVGAARDNGYGQESRAAYVFDMTTGQQLLKFHGLDTDAFDDFGISVGIDGDRVIVGAESADLPGQIEAGAAYLFSVPEPSALILAIGAFAGLASRRGRSTSHTRV
jgi:FG-GAP repeat